MSRRCWGASTASSRAPMSPILRFVSEVSTASANSFGEPSPAADRCSCAMLSAAMTATRSAMVFLVRWAMSRILPSTSSTAASSASRSSGPQATRYSRPMIFTSRKFGSRLISGILGDLVYQAFETLARGGHRLAQMQALGLGRGHLVAQNLVLGTQLVDQGDNLFDLGFE